MAIEKNSFKVARLEPENHTPNSRDTFMSSDDDDFQQRNTTSGVESDGEDDEFDDCDSGAGSDDFDLLELGEAGGEFCQIGDQTCSIPYELYDLPGLKDVLSMEVWNEVLTEEERFGLAKYLPDMDVENFVCTLKELLSGDNLHFGNPVDKLFDMLKGGLCEPRVALYRQGLNFFQLRKHYQKLRKHQNSMVSNVCQMRDVWMNYKGYSVEEKLHVFNIMKSQKSLMNENMEELGSESSDPEESVDGLWGKKGKDPKLAHKKGLNSAHSGGRPSDTTSHVRKDDMESFKRGKQNVRGNLKSDRSKVTDRFQSPLGGVERKSGRLGLPLSRYDGPADYDSSVAARLKEHEIMMEDEEAEQTMYEISVQRDRNYPRAGEKDSRGVAKFGKRRESLKAEEEMHNFVGMPVTGSIDLHTLGRNKAINKLSDITVLTTDPSHSRTMYNGGAHTKYAESLQQFSAKNTVKSGKGSKKGLPLKGNDFLDESDPASDGKQHGRLFPADSSYASIDLIAKSKKWKMGTELDDLNTNDKLFHGQHRGKASKDKFAEIPPKNGRREGPGSTRVFGRNEDTESDSSEQMDEDEDENPILRSKWAYPGGVPGPDMKKPKLSKLNKKDSYASLDGSSHTLRKMENYSENLEVMEAARRGKMHDLGYVNIMPRNFNGISFPGSANVIGNQQFYPLGRNGHLERYGGDNFHIPLLRPPHPLEERLRGDMRYDLGVSPSNFMPDYNYANELFRRQPPPADARFPFKLGKKGQMVELSPGHYHERPDATLAGCNTLQKKRKGKDDSAYLGMQYDNDCLLADPQFHFDDMYTSKKRGKNKFEDAYDTLDNGIPEPPMMEMEVEVEPEPEPKPEKKPLPLITPTVHTDFSFSIMHLLSAVRVAMVTLVPEDSSVVVKDNDTSNCVEETTTKEVEENKQEEETSGVNSSMDVNTSFPSVQANVPSLSVQEIMNRVRSSPGDPAILETQEPLLDLVRGVLKIFASRTAPLGAKGWKPLVMYRKATKSWTWIGPVPHNSPQTEAVEEVTSPDAWGLPHRMLVKLVDSFANWLKNSQETLQQIGSLPEPPLALMQMNLEEKDRFKDLRAQKSLSTIIPSSEEIRAYFRKEELLRYLIPDRAFSYTAADGKKSIVAPLRRCGGKPTSKARDHFMLKRDRPPHVTILCLVRDAAARMPGSIGTRADVCTLIRDSQYVVEDVSDSQVNQVVSGALDRLHYERDPCVQFDGERKLWVYLHREREEEDFEDDGTSSTKKWKKKKEDASVAGGVSVASEPGFDLVSDLNVAAEDDKRSEADYQNGDDQVEEDNAQTVQGTSDTPAAAWNDDGKEFICQENSNNEDFDMDGLEGEPPS